VILPSPQQLPGALTGCILIAKQNGPSSGRVEADGEGDQRVRHQPLAGIIARGSSSTFQEHETQPPDLAAR